MRVLYVLLMSFVLASPAVAQAQGGKTLDIYVIDVDGGEATLFVSPTGQSMLVDAGWPGFEGRDADRIMTVAKLAGIKQIDYLVITHFHADHMGGVPQLAARLPIRNYIDHGADVQPGERAAAAFKPYDELRMKANHVVAKPGYTIPITGIKATVIASGGAVLSTPLPGAGQPNALCADFKLQETIKGQEEIRAEDGRSVSTHIAYGQFRTVIMGDLGWNFERDLMCPTNKVGTIDMYLVSHHGSETSGSPAFVYPMRARAGVMNNGAGKGGAAQTFQILKDAPGFEDLWQNHYSIPAGDLNKPEPMMANLEPKTLSAKSASGQPAAPVHMGPANWTKISAFENGTFTITNSRTGQSKTYAVRRSTGAQ
jgi:beta-lactamase superfamily II metal-dependent hydrolase